MSTPAAQNNPVLPEHVALFAVYVKKWQRILNLMDWRMFVSPKRSTSMADVLIKLADRLARFRVGKHFGLDEVTPATIEATVVHEILHVLLDELTEVARANGPHEDVQSAQHRVINTIEPLLMLLAAQLELK